MLERQEDLVNSFTDEGFFQLNVQKCEILCFARYSCSKSSVTPACKVGGCQLPVNNFRTCMGSYSKDDLLATI